MHNKNLRISTLLVAAFVGLTGCGIADYIRMIVPQQSYTGTATSGITIDPSNVTTGNKFKVSFQTLHIMTKNDATVSIVKANEHIDILESHTLSNLQPGQVMTEEFSAPTATGTYAVIVDMENQEITRLSQKFNVIEQGN